MLQAGRPFAPAVLLGSGPPDGAGGRGCQWARAHTSQAAPGSRRMGAAA
jgi:hypothetical protein